MRHNFWYRGYFTLMCDRCGIRRTWREWLFGVCVIDTADEDTDGR